MSDYQKKVKRGHARKKRKLIGTGGYRKLKYGAKRPSYKRSKSAPPGAGALEEDNNNEVVTFDFDETLAIWEYDDYEKIKSYPNAKTIKILKEFANRGYDIYIVTSRHKSRSADVESFLERYELPIKGVHYAAGDKATILNNLNSKVHFDDDEEEFGVYKRLYPKNDMIFYHIKFDVGWNDYYNGSLPSQVFVGRVEIKNEVI